MDDDGELRAGSTFGRYVIERRLGSGGMGVVYQATHVGLRKPVVIKVLNPEHARNKEARARFLREGEAASRIRHPHVVDVSDVGIRGDLPYLVMEYLEGEDLGQRFDREGALPLDVLVDTMLPVISAVSAAHEEGVIHRDLKPENIFLSRTRSSDMHPKVLDFGISRVVNDTSGRVRTQTAGVLGTPEYMSPEQAQGERGVDDRTDQYALGVILYEGATGRRPFQRDSVYALITAVVEGRFEAPRVHRPELPEGFEAVVLRAMAREVAERFPSVRDLGAALLPFAGERARLFWAPSFAGEADKYREPTLLDVKVTGAPEREDVHTLSETGREVDTTTQRFAPARVRSRRALAGVAVLVACGVIAAVVVGTRGARRASHATERPATAATPVVTAPPVAVTAPTVAAAPVARAAVVPGGAETPSPVGAAANEHVRAPRDRRAPHGHAAQQRPVTRAPTTSTAPRVISNNVVLPEE